MNVTGCVLRVAATWAAVATCPAVAAAAFPVPTSLGAVQAFGGNTSTPQVATNSKGDTLVAWQTGGGDQRDRVWSAYRPAGQKFGPATELSPESEAVSEPHVAIDADGNALVAFTRAAQAGQIDTVAVAAVSSDGKPAPAIDLAIALPDKTYPGGGPPQPAFDGNGDAAVAWISRDLTSTRSDPDFERVQIAVRPRGGNFAPAQQFAVAAGGSKQGVSNVRTAGGRNIVVAWSNGARIETVVRPRGTSFSPVRSVRAADPYGPEVAQSVDGSAVVVWRDSLPSVPSRGRRTRISAATIASSGAIAGPVPVSGTDTYQDSLGVAVGPRGASVVTWTANVAKSRVARGAYARVPQRFAAPFNVSAAGRNADTPATAFDSLGHPIIVWYRGGTFGPRRSRSSIQARYGSRAGIFAKAIQVSPVSRDALYAGLAVDGANRATVTWIGRDPRLGETVQAITTLTSTLRG
ncbi:hypothetical protein DSM112329_00179 [Paraconexibacter sp. AEG42_29]|uniref:Uncharacterized protein n=1 Tax=Paraconexibacter sp. AEG42_29 TaxID=2997339 RepID=A0AAU7ANY8_9ACTN